MIDERAARQRGDVVRSALAPLAGALIGGVAALSAPGELVPFAARSLAGHATLDEARALLAHALVGPLLGAFVGALVLGLLQTHGYLGWPKAPRSDAPRIEPRRAPPWLVSIGWLLVLGVILDAAGRLVTLHAGAEPIAIAAAAGVALRRAVRAIGALVLALALVDHLVRARARAARLDVETPSRPLALARDPLPAWLERADLVLFDGEHAVAMVDGKVLARAEGLGAVAMREAARAAGKRVRAQSGLPS